MGRVATGTIMPTTSVPNEMRSTDVVTDSMMNGDCFRALAIAGQLGNVGFAQLTEVCKLGDPQGAETPLMTIPMCSVSKCPIIAD